jgi:response regulator RpfG family c-di-GMP phosphodiesterase
MLAAQQYVESPLREAAALPTIEEDMASVLVVDDDPSLRRTVASWIESFGYPVRAEARVDAALEAMQQSPSDIALCDVTMVARDGVWLAWRLREQYPQTAIIMATALRDAETAAASLRNDVVDYLLKPFDRARLFEALALARDWHAAAAGDEALHHALQDRLRTRRAELAATLAEGQTTHDAALDGLMAMLQLHERDGRGHARRVARLTLALADALGVSGDGSMLALEHGALLHDIGKLDVPAAILTKSAPLDDAEWEVMRTHPQLGYDLVRKLPRLAGAADFVLMHHEAFDGSGYPHGLTAARIPLGARILAVADAYDSMTHPHTQRPPLPSALAVNEIERCSGSQFDPTVAEALGSVLIDATKEPVQ